MSGPPVLFASYSGVLGGAEQVLVDCVTRLEREVTVACPEGPLAAELRAQHIAHAPLEARPLQLTPAHVAHVAALARDLRQLKPGFLVAWGARAVLAAPFAGRPWLAVHHDLLPPAVRAVTKVATGRADKVAAASRAIAIQFGDATVLHPGVDLARFTPRPPPPGPPHALVLGALVGWKRPDLALDVAERMPELRLTLAGATLPGDDGSVEAGLRARAAKLGGRVTIGPVSDVHEALANAHVLLHCADVEPYGMALVEALAAGRPVVAPAAGGPLEIVAGGAGRLYAPGDADAAAEALRATLADAQAPAAARRRAEAAFDVTASAARLEALIP
jgi:glycosyltransferase involved in cell wall biosynthesis